MRRALALACVLLGAAAGCHPVTSAGDTQVVRFDIAADPSTLDPLFAKPDANGVEQQLAHLAFAPFIDIDAHGRSFPVLIRTIPTRENGGISADGRTITYHLQPRARWQDGKPVTSRDVLFTLRAIMDDRNPVRSRAGYDTIERATAPDASTVVLRLRRRWAPAVSTFFSYGTAPQFVLPAHVFAAAAPLATSPFGASPIGDGPYRLRSWQRGERLVYERNSNYWGTPAKTPRIDVHVVPDPGTNLTLLQSKAIEWNLIAPLQQPVLAKDPSIAYRYVPLALVVGIALNLAHPPLDDVRVRRALAASIDRRFISDRITLGRYPPIDSDQPLSSWAYDASARQPAYDPVAADRLLDAAGWRRGAEGTRMKGGHPLALTYVQFPESTTGVRTATVVQSELHARGIAVTIKSVSNAQLFLPASSGGVLATGQYDMAYVPWPMGADPDDSFLITCHGPSNIMHYCNPTVDALEQEALTTASQAERRALYARIQGQLVADVPIVFLFNPSYIYAYRNALSGFAPNAFAPTWNAAGWQLVPATSEASPG